MKRETLVLAVILAVGIGITLWRQLTLEAELRDAIAEFRARTGAISPLEASEDSQAGAFHEGDSAGSGELLHVKRQGERNAQRLDDLEKTVTQIADFLNGMMDEQDQKVAAATKPAWSAGQACGPPDTFVAGDQGTAWASASPDAGEEWLRLEYGAPQPINQVIVRETFNPGAISKVTAILENGSEAVIWSGVESLAAAPVERSFPAQGVVAQTVKIYLDTKRVPGWNEIDAVAIVGPDGQRHWAVNASASSSYGASTTQLNDSTRVLGIIRDLGIQ